MHAAARALQALLGVASTPGTPLERDDRAADPPRLQGAQPLEPGSARTVGATDVAEVAAFLDGVQRSRVLAVVGVRIDEELQPALQLPASQQVDGLPETGDRAAR